MTSTPGTPGPFGAGAPFAGAPFGGGGDDGGEDSPPSIEAFAWNVHAPPMAAPVRSRVVSRRRVVVMVPPLVRPSQRPRRPGRAGRDRRRRWSRAAPGT